jgi:hypothetical protein
MFLQHRDAILCTLATVTFPFVCQFATIFFSELSWLCFSIAWVYYLLQSEEFSNTYHSSMAGIFLGLMLATRPAESIAISVIPIGYFVLRAFRRNVLKLRDLLLPAVVLAVCIGLLAGSLFMVSLTRGPIWAMTGVTIALCMSFAIRNRKSYSVAHLSFWTCVSGISVFWWAGFIRPLYEWVHLTSFGYMSRVLGSEQNPLFHSNLATPRHGPASLPAIIVEIFYYYGAVQIWPMIALGVAFIAFEKLRRQESTRAITPLIVISAGVLLPTFTLYWLSGTQDPRRAMAGITLMLVALMVAALRGPGRLANMGFALIAVLALGQIYLLAMAVFAKPIPNIAVRGWFGPPLRPPATVRDGNDVISERLAHTLAAGSRVAVYTMALFGPDHRIYEPAALELGNVMQGGSITASYLWDEGDYAGVIDRLTRMGYKFLLLDSWDDPQIRQGHSPYVDFTAGMLDYLQAHGGPPPGLTLVDTFELGGRTQRVFAFTPR